MAKKKFRSSRAALEKEQFGYGVPEQWLRLGKTVRNVGAEIKAGEMLVRAEQGTLWWMKWTDR